MNCKHTECGTVNDKPSVAQLVKKFPYLMKPLCSKACRKSGAVHFTRSQTNLSHNPLQYLLYIILIFPLHTFIFPLTLFLHQFGRKPCTNFS